MELEEIVSDLPRYFAQVPMRSLKVQQVISDEEANGLEYLGSEIYFSVHNDGKASYLRINLVMPEKADIHKRPTRERVLELVKLDRDFQRNLGLSPTKIAKAKNYFNIGVLHENSFRKGQEAVVERTLEIDYKIKPRKGEYNQDLVRQAVWDLVMRPLGYLIQSVSQ